MVFSCETPIELVAVRIDGSAMRGSVIVLSESEGADEKQSGDLSPESVNVSLSGRQIEQSFKEAPHAHRVEFPSGAGPSSCRMRFIVVREERTAPSIFPFTPVEVFRLQRGAPLPVQQRPPESAARATNTGPDFIESWKLTSPAKDTSRTGSARCFTAHHGGYWRWLAGR